MDVFHPRGLAEYLFYLGRNKFNLPLQAVCTVPGKYFFNAAPDTKALATFPEVHCCKDLRNDDNEECTRNSYVIEKCRQCLNTHINVYAKSRVCLSAPYSSTVQTSHLVEDFSIIARRFYAKHLLVSLSRQHETCRDIKIIGTDTALLETLDSVLAASASDRPVLIYGETGTGKELWAHAIHLLSNRREEPIIPVNCAHLRDENMAMSKLFGHTKGSFTGANTTREGAFKRADKGILFLDEIEALPVHAQEMLLRTIEHGEIHPLGSDMPFRVDVKIIAATNRNLSSLLENGQLRDDFYFRLMTHYIELPALRDREQQDILRLASYYLENLNAENDREKSLSDEVREIFLRYDWPGNVRELKNVMDSAFYSSGYRNDIEPRHLIPHLRDDIVSQRGLSGNGSSRIYRLFTALTSGKDTFWRLVRGAYIRGELSRIQVQELIELGLEQHGSLRDVSTAFHINEADWRKFYLFLYRTIYNGNLPDRNSVS